MNLLFNSANHRTQKETIEGQREILAQLDDLKNTYLAPIKQSQDRLEERVRRQELEIDNCKETIGLVKEKLETIYDEISRRFKLNSTPASLALR